MNPVIRTRWADALESGKYDQTSSALRDDIGYCCLGVLCDIYAQDNGAKWEQCTKHAGHQRVGGTSTSSFLPQEVADWAMLGDEDVNPNGTRPDEFDIQFPTPNKHKRQKDGTYEPMPDHGFMASTLNDNHMNENDEESEGSFKEIAKLVRTMPSTYKESQRGTLARLGVEDEEYDFRKYVGKEKGNE